MMDRRRVCRIGCVLALAIVLAPPSSSAQSEGDRPGLRVGPVEFRPRLILKDIGVDSNVFNEPANAKSDFTLTAAPDVEISTHPGRLKLAYTTAAEFVYFRKYTSERARNGSIGGRAELDLSWLKPFASFSSTHTSARPNSEIDVRAEHYPWTYTAGTTVKVASRTSIAILGRRTRETYDENAEFRGEDLARSLDTRINTYETSFNVELTPFTTFSIVGAKEEQRFDHAPERSADSVRIAPTLTFSPLGLITGSASFGYRHFNGLDQSLPDYSGFVASGSVGILFYDRSRVDTTFTRDVRYSYERALPYYIVSGIRASLSVRTYGPLDLRALGGRESMDYRSLNDLSSPGKDLLVLYGGGIGYRIGAHARVAVDAELSHRSSERDDAREFRNHRVLALVTWGAVNP
jgi:hypothetical protein